MPVLAVALLAPAILAASCANNKRPTPPPPVIGDPLQSSPAIVLANLQTAYQERNFDEYEKLFSPNFVFVFDPADVSDPDHPTPQQWLRQDEMDSSRNFFFNDRVEFTTLSWSPGEAEPSDEVIPNSWKVRVERVHLVVRVRTEQNEVWILEVKSAVAVFYFREDPSYTYPNGKHKWYCIRWEDSPIRGLAATMSGPDKVEEVSWGMIKWYYH